MYLTIIIIVYMIYNKYNKGEKKMKSKQGIKFKDLNIGDNFDWVNDDEPQWNSFFHPCVKTSTRKYIDYYGQDYTVGSINAIVYHVRRARQCK